MGLDPACSPLLARTQAILPLKMFYHGARAGQLIFVNGFARLAPGPNLMKVKAGPGPVGDNRTVRNHAD